MDAEDIADTRRYISCYTRAVHAADLIVRMGGGVSTPLRRPLDVCSNPGKQHFHKVDVLISQVQSVQQVQQKYSLYRTYRTYSKYRLHRLHSTYTQYAHTTAAPTIVYKKWTCRHVHTNPHAFCAQAGQFPSRILCESTINPWLPVLEGRVDPDPAKAPQVCIHFIYCAS